MPSDSFPLETTDRSDDATFRDFYAGYCQSFVLPDEMEDEEGFAACLALNHGAEYERLSALHGPYREHCVVMRDGAGRAMAGANYIAVDHSRGSSRPCVTANLNYIFVLPDYRGAGRFSALVRAVRAQIGGLFGPSTEDALVFIEQNDPLRMSAEDYERDTRFTGMDQFDRLGIWARQGALVVDFGYSQPPLSADQEADGNLVYSVMGASESHLHPRLLAHHLGAFFGISVMKGGALPPVASQQLDQLEALAQSGGRVDLLDPAPALAAAAAGQRAGGSFREFARAAITARG